jgi:hypothetical protein
VFDQAVLDLTGANAVARGLEHIVCAALVPQVAVGISRGQVPRAAPVSRPAAPPPMMSVWGVLRVVMVSLLSKNAVS